MLDDVPNDLVDIVFESGITFLFILNCKAAFPEIFAAWGELELPQDALYEFEVGLAAEDSFRRFV